MLAKTEKNLASSLPVSKPRLSIKSIIKDLQDLDKSLITKNEMEAINSKMKMLEEENSRIKAELQTTEADRKLYYNQFHQNVKEVCELKAEIQTLKAEISSLKMAEQSNIEEIACSSFQSAIPVNDTRSEDGHEDEIQAIASTLAIEDRSGSNSDDNNPNANKKKITKKRGHQDSDSDEIQPVKKPPVKRMTKRRKKAKYSSEEEESTTEEGEKPNDPVGQLCQQFPKVPRSDITRSKF